jgi:NAD(P)H-hydrate epimerase
MPVSPAEMTAIESAAFARGVVAEDLMDRAGQSMADVVSQFFPQAGHAALFCGKGHNAGDVLVAGTHLASRGWTLGLDLAFPESELAPLTANKLAALRVVNHGQVRSGAKSLIALDGLLGIGSSGEPREPIASAIRRIHDLRERHHAFVFAADIPSGLDGLTGRPAEACVQADCTVTIGLVKSGLLADEATNYVGRLALVPLEELQLTGGDRATLITPDFLQRLLPPRNFNSHKGTWGRLGVVAGSAQYLGAARFCCAAAVTAGAGLVTLYATQETAAALRGWCAPEVMVKSVDHLAAILDDHMDALAIGPGLGDMHDEEILKIVSDAECPVVIDADAINALSRHPGALADCKGPRLLTPHPMEMERLVPGTMKSDRRATAEEFVRGHQNCTLLLKGARTVITSKDSATRFNSTGNPGMGTGGMGDVLTGVCGALLASGMAPVDAASLGTWLCGRAAEAYIFGSDGSPQSLTPSDTIHALGSAFRALGMSGSY